MCRRASSDLLPGPSTRGFSPTSFEVVDFNGDRQIDLVGGFADRIEFRTGDASGSFLTGFPATPTLPVTGAIAVGHLDSDPHGDVLLPTALGFLVWRGQAQGPPLRAAYAAFAGPADGSWVIPVRYPAVGEEGVLVALYRDGTDIAATVVVKTKLHTGVPLGKGESIDQLGGRVAVGDIDHDQDDDVAIGFPGSAAVKIYAVRRDLLGRGYYLGGLRSDSPNVVDVSQPRSCEGCPATVQGFQVGGGVRIADVDGDDHLDLLVGVSGASPGTDAVAVARGDGQGGFANAYLDTRFEFLASPATVEEGYPGELRRWPIAAGDLDADGVTDYVSPNGVFLASHAAPHALRQTEFRESLEPWTAATLSDVDGDGTLDVVAIRAGQPWVDVLRCENGASNCTTTGRFESRRYPTKLGVTKVRTGRLQGNRAMDLVLVESAGPELAEEDALSVMYGETHNWPAAPVRQARFHRIEQLEIGRTRVPGARTVDLFEDVQVSTRSADEKVSYGILSANGTRELSSPFVLATNAKSLNPEYSKAERALVGRFAGSEHPYRDLILLGRSADDIPRAWWVPGAEDAAFAPTAAGQDLHGAFGGDFDLDCARVAAGDRDGDGRDELAVVFGRAICKKHASTQLAVGRVAEGAHIAFDVRDVDTGGADGARIILSDLDGDGRADLLLARPGTVQVFWGESSELSSVDIVDLPAEEQVLDITTIARSENATGANRVAVLTDASVIVISGDGVNRLVATSVASVKARSLRSADVDADGLGDLLLLGADGTDVLFTIPASPLGGRP